MQLHAWRYDHVKSCIKHFRMNGVIYGRKWTNIGDWGIRFGLWDRKMNKSRLSNFRYEISWKFHCCIVHLCSLTQCMKRKCTNVVLYYFCHVYLMMNRKITYYIDRSPRKISKYRRYFQWTVSLHNKNTYVYYVLNQCTLYSHLAQVQMHYVIHEDERVSAIKRKSIAYTRLAVLFGD